MNVQLLGRPGWRTQHSVSTDAAGKAQTRVRMASNRTLRARYAGDTGLLPSSSPPVAIGVRPQVTVSVGTQSVAPGERGPGHRGRGAPQDARGADREATDPLGRVGARVASHGGAAIRDGCARTLRVRRPALYRVRLSVRRDARNLAARSAAVASEFSGSPLDGSAYALARWRAPAARLAAVQPLPAQQHARRLQQDARVEAQRPVLDVPEVELDPLVPGQRGAALTPAPSR